MKAEDLRNLILDALTDVAPEIDPTQIETDVELREQVDIDSMDLLNLVIGVHERTGVDIPESDYAKLVTIEDLVEYLVARLAG